MMFGADLRLLILTEVPQSGCFALDDTAGIPDS
jgi:hypothetical protein